MPRILVVDDDEEVRNSMSITLRREGYDVEEAASGEDGVRRLGRQTFDLMICDQRMEGMTGISVLQRTKQDCPDLEVIMMTAFGSIDHAVEAMRAGAYGYLEKPFQEEELVYIVRQAVERNQLRIRVRALERTMTDQFGVDSIITVDKRMQEIIKNALTVALTDSNILITGESGTGKELIAGMIHTHSALKDRPFVPVNCGGLPDQLLESELFGHVKGAFTGAITNKHGLVEDAEGGTLFLDEIGETSPSLQVKLLRFIQSGEIRRVGSNETRHVNVRIIAATNRDLQQAMRESTFREDLYYRISVIPLHLPPLRERYDDVPLLAQRFLALYAKRFEKETREFEDKAISIMQQYRWPGNVRELMNAIEHGVALSQGRIFESRHLPRRILEGVEFVPETKNGSATLAEIEKKYILKVLRDTHGNQKKACRILGLSKTTLYRRLKLYDISPKSMVEY